ncbi:MAG: hypothetical protein NWS69_00585, partial [Pseudomonadales bacterium]|nr:hypothetical protein [Pseudomonadales bacterium]
SPAAVALTSVPNLPAAWDRASPCWRSPSAAFWRAADAEACSPVPGLSAVLGLALGDDGLEGKDDGLEGEDDGLEGEDDGLGGEDDGLEGDDGGLGGVAEGIDGDDGELEGEGGGLGDLQLASQTRDNNASASMRRCRQACWRPRRMPGRMPRRLPGGKLRRVRVLLGNSVVIG